MNWGVILWQAFMKPVFALSVRNDWIPNNDVVVCLKSQKLTAASGHIQHHNISNVSPTESYKMSERSIFSCNHSSPNKSANLPKRQAIAGQRTVRLLLVLNDAHNPINNPTVQIADPGKQNTLLLRNYTTNGRAISHNDGDVCSYHHGIPF